MLIEAEPHLRDAFGGDVVLRLEPPFFSGDELFARVLRGISSSLLPPQGSPGCTRWIVPAHPALQAWDHPQEGFSDGRRQRRVRRCSTASKGHRAIEAHRPKAPAPHVAEPLLGVIPCLKRRVSRNDPARADGRTLGRKERRRFHPVGRNSARIVGLLASILSRLAGCQRLPQLGDVAARHTASSRAPARPSATDDGPYRGSDRARSRAALPPRRERATRSWTPWTPAARRGGRRRRSDAARCRSARTAGRGRGASRSPCRARGRGRAPTRRCRPSRR